MALFKAYIISGILLVGCVLGYPQATSDKPTLQPTPPPAKDGSPRPACEHMHQCYPWALDECQEARDMGLFIKAYCYDNYCYAICPPVFPGTLPDEIATLPPPDNIYNAEEATATIMNAEQDTTFTLPLEPPITAYPSTLAWAGKNDDDDDYDDDDESTTYPQLDTTDAETQKMTTITKTDGRTVTVPVPIPLPTIMPPSDEVDDDDDDDDDEDERRQSTTLSTKTTST